MKVNSFDVLTRRVFGKYASGKADERYFKNALAEWIQKRNECRRGFYDELYHHVWKRNNDGTTLKYMFFNDRLQRCFLDRYFEEWAKKITRKIETTLLTFQH